MKKTINATVFSIFTAITLTSPISLFGAASAAGTGTGGTSGTTGSTGSGTRDASGTGTTGTGTTTNMGTGTNGAYNTNTIPGNSQTDIHGVNTQNNTSTKQTTPTTPNQRRREHINRRTNSDGTINTNGTAVPGTDRSGSLTGNTDSGAPAAPVAPNH